MFGLTGFSNFIVSFIIFLIILLPIIWLILPLIFKYIVAKYFEGSYYYKKDSIKTQAPYPKQEDEFKLILEKNNNSYSISFGEGREFTNGAVEIHYNGKFYASKISSENDVENIEQLEFISEEEKIIDTELGKAKRISWNWKIPFTEVEFTTSFIIPEEKSRKNIILFETTTKDEINGTSIEEFGKTILNFPVFKNQSFNKRIFNYKDIVFCPGSRDFKHSNSPVCLFDDDKNTVIISAFDNFVTNIIEKRIKKGEEDYTIVCGINGEIDLIPDNHEHKYIMVLNKRINESFKKWGDILLESRNVSRSDKEKYKEHDMQYLGYYTDNGAYYYYNPIKNVGYDGTLLEVKKHAEEIGIPYKFYHLDSWWYQKSVKKIVRTLLGPLGRIVGGGLYGGTTLWEPDSEVFMIEPQEGKSEVELLYEQFGGLPFTAHNRWYSEDSPYLEKYNFIKEGNSAMPKDDPNFWEEIMDNCVKYHFSTYEQDWLKTHVSKFTFLRTEIGAAHTWLKNMAASAEKRDIGIQYCMATPALMMESTNFKSVITARASGDYSPRWPKRYDVPHFLQASMFMHALGIWPFKDTFQSTSTGLISGERCPALMALLSNLSGSMVAPGDKIGFMSKDVIKPVCRKDGYLYKPDKPITACDITYIKNRKYYLARTYSKQGDFTWNYVIAINLWPKRVKDKTYTIEDLDFTGDYLRYNWFTNQTQKLSSQSAVSHKLKYEEYEYEIYAPILPNNMVFIGDPSKYVTMNDVEFSDFNATSEGITVKVNNIKDETSEILVYSESAPKEIFEDSKKLEEIDNIENSRYFYDEKTNLLHVWIYYNEDAIKTIKII